MAVPLAHLPADQRPRERLVASGPDALTDAELLALIVRHGRAGEGAVELSTRLLCHYGGLTGLARARPEELSAVAGIGAAKASAIVAAVQLGRRLDHPGHWPPLCESADVAALAQSHLRGLRRERVIAMVCDGQLRARHVVTVSEGSAERALLPIREILNAVLRHDGQAFAIAHNHPGGDPTPSETDHLVTLQLNAAADVVGLRFLDHIVVADHSWVVVPRQLESRDALSHEAEDPGCVAATTS